MGKRGLPRALRRAQWSKYQYAPSLHAYRRPSSRPGRIELAPALLCQTRRNASPDKNGRILELSESRNHCGGDRYACDIPVHQPFDYSIVYTLWGVVFPSFQQCQGASEEF